MWRTSQTGVGDKQDLETRRLGRRAWRLGRRAWRQRDLESIFSPHLPISPSPHLPIPPSPHLPLLPYAYPFHSGVTWLKMSWICFK
ncbi:MAG: hypothetical protein ACHBN1_24810 [Heteroscytonema crispum UTEX LB 1556]